MAGDEADIFVNADGTLQLIYSDAVVGALFGGELGVQTRRASNVEPFGYGWIADMRPVGGPVLWDTSTGNPLGRAAFKTRQAALDAEIAYLAARMADGRVTFTA